MSDINEIRMKASNAWKEALDSGEEMHIQIKGVKRVVESALENLMIEMNEKEDEQGYVCGFRSAPNSNWYIFWVVKFPANKSDDSSQKTKRKFKVRAQN